MMGPGTPLPPRPTPGFFFALCVAGFYVGLQTLEGSGVQSGDAFGAAVARSSATIAIGANLASNGAGMVYLFAKGNGGQWQQAGTLGPASLASGDAFGTAVALRDDLLLAGAQGDSGGKGAVYVFQGSGASWSQINKLTASDSVAGDNYGSAVAISAGGVLAIGAPKNSVAGAVYVLQAGSTAGVFTQTAKVVPASGQQYDFFGAAVAVSGSKLVVGAPFQSVNGGRSGQVHYYNLTGSRWSLRQSFTSSGEAALVP